MADVILYNSRTNKYVKAIDCDPETDLKDAKVTNWTSIATEAFRFPEPSFTDPGPSIDDVEGSDKWHAKKKAVETLQAGMFSFQQDNHLEKRVPD